MHCVGAYGEIGGDGRPRSGVVSNATYGAVDPNGPGDRRSGAMSNDTYGALSPDQPGTPCRVLLMLPLNGGNRRVVGAP